MALPQILLDVAFTNNPNDVSPTWVTVSDDTPATSRVMSLHVKRGASVGGHVAGEVDSDTGTARVRLRNPDRRFDPSHGSSPYSPNVLPVKQTRIRAIFNSITYFLMQGDVEDWPQDWQGRLNHVNITILDAFQPLSEVDIVITRPVELPGARINAILDAAGWPAGKRIIGTGVSPLQAVTGKEGSALSMLKFYSRGEEGHIYVDGQGNFIFRDRHYRLKPPGSTNLLTLSNTPGGGEMHYETALPNAEKERIKNDIFVKVEGGNTIHVSDATSITQYRIRSTTTEVEFSNENDALDKANYHISRLKDPIFTVKEVTLRPFMDDALWPHVLGREPGDRITVEATGPASAGNQAQVIMAVIIEGIEHTYSHGDWATKWILSPADINNYWILGDATYGLLGTTTKLAA